MGCLLPMSDLASWLPTYHMSQRHEIELPIPPEVALRLALSLPASPDRLVAWLFRLRGLWPTGSLEEFFTANGFTLLERTSQTVVFGLVAGPFLRPIADAAVWRTADPRGGVKIAADFRAQATPTGSRFSTETRVQALSRMSRALFWLYWLVVGPFSKMIRRRWLRAVAQAAA
jgi:hypothetical protein